ncbi:ATP-binding cassette domain-containing protein [Aeromicrobium sp. UC242_57]|uniref:ATP-binding cassette domain-containing protein n=1 Tax=Aeromicrobium sp. UC242_57 TaxID=3374624 RepID=UPI0037964D3E
MYPADSGEYLFEGKPVSVHGPKDAGALGIEVVYQDLALCENLDIVENMFLGREKTNGIILDETTMESKAREALASLSVRTVKSVRQSVSSLSGGQRQTVAIAKSVLWNSKVVLLMSRRRPWASLRRVRCSTWCAGSPTPVSASC